MSSVIWPSHCPSPWIDQTSISLPLFSDWHLLLQTYAIWISDSSSFTSSIRSVMVRQQWPTPRLLASLCIPSQDNEEPDASTLIGQQEILPTNHSPGMAWYHKAPLLKIHGGGEGCREVQVLSSEKWSVSSTPINELSQVHFPCFLILSGSVFVA